IGAPISRVTERTTPPFAVPSSLVSARPVTPVNSWNVFAWAMALRPFVASRTSRTSCGAPGISFPITRTTFRTSSIRWDFVWSRPAVTTRTTNGYGGTTFKGTIRGASVSATIPRKRARSASVSGSSPRRHAARSASTYSCARSAPPPARINASSSWSRTFSSTGPIPRAIASTFMKRSSRVLESPSFSLEKKAPRDLSFCSLKERLRPSPGGPAVQLDGNGAGDPVLLRRDPVQDARQFRRPLVVRDEEVLVPPGHLPDQRVEPVHVGVVEGGIYLVEQAERRRLDEEDGEDEADGGERLFPAGEAA